jgi:hypothetical protein
LKHLFQASKNGKQFANIEVENFNFGEFDMQKKVKIFLTGFVCVMLASLFIACGGGYGHRYGYPYGSGYGFGYGYQSERQVYDYGYRKGYEDGIDDRRDGDRFNYYDHREFRNGISNDRYTNDRFRQGYARGYEQGYYSGGNRYNRY